MLVQVKSGKETEVNLYIGKRVRMARNEIGLSQSDLSQSLSIHAVTISEKERARSPFTAEELHKIAQVTEKPIEWFYPPNGDEE